MPAPLRSWLARAALAASSLLLAACLPVTLPGGTSGPACPEGTYHVTDQVLSGLIPSSLGNLELSPQPGGDLTLDVTPTTWALTGSQSFTVSGSTQYGGVSGTATGTIDAAGSWTKLSATQLEFTLTSLDGSATFTGTVGGASISTEVSLEQVGIDDVYGFTGTADFACGSAPSLTLTFTSLHLELERS